MPSPLKVEKGKAPSASAICEVIGPRKFAGSKAGSIGITASFLLLVSR